MKKTILLLLTITMFSVGAMAQTLGEAGTNTTVQGTNVNIKGGTDGTTRVTGGTGGVVIGSGSRNTTITGATTTINTTNTNITGDLAQIKSKTVNVGKLDATVTVDGLDTRLNSQKTTVAGSFIVGSGGDPRTGQNGIYQLNTSGTTAARIDRNGTFSIIGTDRTETAPVFNVDGKSGVLQSKADIRTTGMTTSNGFNSSGQKITGVANGTDANDAVNFSQLDLKADKSQVATDISIAKEQAITSSNSYTDGKINTLDTKLNDEVGKLDGRITTLDATVTTEISRVDSRIDATNTTVSNLTTTVETNRVEAAKATAQVQTNLNTQVNRLDKDIASLEDRKADKKQVTADIATAKSEAISIANTYTDKAEKRLTDRVDAVGRQLDDLRVDLGNETTRAMTAEMNITNEMRGLGAMTAAMVSAQGSQLYSPTKRGNVSIGTGYYRGATAVSAGVSYFTSSNTKINTNIATGTHIKLAVGIGASFGF
jgi:hypothetical protein